MKTLRLFLLSALLALAASMASAQVFETAASVNLIISPEFPEPLSETSAKITTFSFDLDRANIQWILNGRVVSQGVGVKEISFRTGAPGSVSALRAVISPQGGGRIEKAVEIRPEAIDLLVDSKSYVPFWYKGAPLVTPGGMVRAIAMPHFIFQGSRLDPKTLIYQWEVDGEVRGDLSGRGRQTLEFKAPNLAGVETKVAVKISSPQGSLAARASTFIGTRSPELIFYERHPLEGLLTSQALYVKTLAAGENLEAGAVPFFANFGSKSELDFGWSFDGEAVEPNPLEPDIFLIKSVAGILGQAEVGLVIKNLKNILEELQASFLVYVE